MSLSKEYSDQLEEISRLEEDWDGEKAKGFTDGIVVSKAKDVLEYLTERTSYPKMRISPCGDGTIDFFWREENGLFLVNVESNGSLSYHGKKNNQEFEGADLESFVRDMKKYVK